MSASERAVLIDAEIARWKRDHPQLSSRLDRARMLIDNVVASCPLPGSDGTEFLVEGARDDYRVRVLPSGEASCTCPDAASALVTHCKHQLAVFIRLAVALPAPLDPRSFEDEVRRQLAREPDPSFSGDPDAWEPDAPDAWWRYHGEFAIRMLLWEIDRLRALATNPRP